MASQVSSPASGIALQHSTLYTMLPTPVRKCIAPLPSLRRSFSAYNVQAKESNTVVARRTWAGDLGVGYVEEDSTLASSGRGSTSPRSSLSMTPSSPEPAAGDLGTEWRYASHGARLLETVITEAKYPSSRNQSLARQQYINSVAYLLHGLPQDLDPHEVTTLENAMPPALRISAANNGKRSTSHKIGPRSLPRRTLASAIVQLFLFFQIFLPYLQLFLKSAYDYDRTHRISERALAAGVSVLDNIGSKSFELIRNLVKSGKGHSFQVLAALSIWWIREISSGIQEGMENCVELTDKRKGDVVMVEKGV